MEPNKRKTLGEEIRARMDALGLSTISLAEELAKSPLKVDPTKYYKLIQRVLRGKKPVPKGAVLAWAKALRWDEARDPEAWEHFRQAVLAARAWGKKDGQAHLTRLENEAAELKARVLGLEAERDALAGALRAAESRALAAEAAAIEALQGARPGGPGGR